MFLPAPYGPIVFANPDQAIITFCHESETFPTESTSVLEIYIGGDTAYCIAHLADNRLPPRPMPLDLLQKVVEECFQQGDHHVAPLRVAIVEMRDDVFFGRLFFGDPRTGEVLWDCDCRPSDACWLAIKFKIPMYVHKSVWEAEAKTLQDSTGYKVVQRTNSPQSWATSMGGPLDMMTAQYFVSDVNAENTIGALHAQLHGELHLLKDPELLEEVQLLKKQLEVAVKEENYTAAIALRDHPYMQLSNKIKRAMDYAEIEPAQQMYDELEQLIMQSRQRNCGVESFSE